MFARIHEYTKAFGARRELLLHDEGRVPPSVSVDWNGTITRRVCICRTCDTRVRFGRKERTQIVVRFCGQCAEIRYPDQVKFAVLLPWRLPPFGSWFRFRSVKKPAQRAKLRCVK